MQRKIWQIGVETSLTAKDKYETRQALHYDLGVEMALKIE